MIVGDLETQSCCECGCYFGVPAGFTAERRKDKRSFYCPNGHAMSYTESEADKMRRERDRLAQQVAQRDDEIARQRLLREETERRLTATKGVVTRIRNRVGHGVCPCCTRTFGNLQRHMKTQHPDYVAEAAE
jgi:hypothetical protein